jgi:hypothetical protein
MESSLFAAAHLSALAFRAPAPSDVMPTRQHPVGQQTALNPRQAKNRIPLARGKAFAAGLQELVRVRGGSKRQRVAVLTAVMNNHINKNFNLSASQMVRFIQLLQTCPHDMQVTPYQLRSCKTLPCVLTAMHL